METPSVCLVGFDGRDTDVTENIRLFYQRLGCGTVVAQTPLAADVLVVMRGAPQTIDASSHKQVHIFNYVGQDRRLSDVVGARDVVFVENSDQLAELRPKTGDSGIARVEGWHPVYPHLWVRSLRKIQYRATHVGNAKHISSRLSADIVESKFLHVLRTQRADVWGRGWSDLLPSSQCHGPVSLWKVLDLFRRTAVSFGLRYPAQRRYELISSRFYLGPLNGCPICSAEEPLSRHLPGVHFGEFTGLSPLAEHKRLQLQAVATAFWTGQTSRMEHEMRAHLQRIPNPTSFGSKFASSRLRYFSAIALRRLKSVVE